MTNKNTAKEQQNRYLELNGDPVYMSLFEKIKCLPEYKAAGLTAAFNLCVTASAVSPEQMMMSVGGSLAGLVLAKKASDLLDGTALRMFHGKNYKDLAVDTKPNSKTPPTSPTHIRAATANRINSGVISFITANKLALVGTIGLISAFRSAAAVDPAVETQIQIGMGLLGSIASFMGVHFGASTLRNHRIVQQKWVVTDMPKPIEQKQAAPTTTPLLNPSA